MQHKSVINWQNIPITLVDRRVLSVNADYVKKPCYRTPMKGENLVATIIILLAPAGLVYSWAFYLRRMRREPTTGWRNRATLLSLTLVSLVALLWPVMALLMPRADWGSGLGVGHQVQWVEAWHRPIFRALLLAFVLGLLGRPRLIGPIAVACVGTGLFWLFSTMP